MSNTSDIRRQPTIHVLSVSATEEDLLALRSIFATSPCPLCPGYQWTLNHCDSARPPASVLRRGEVPILLYDRDTDPDAWRQLLAQCEGLAHPPCVIVTSRLADDRLWAEALNLGAYNVLAKPFDAKEVTCMLGQAYLHWKDSALHRSARRGTHSAAAGCS